MGRFEHSRTRRHGWRARAALGALLALAGCVDGSFGGAGDGLVRPASLPAPPRPSVLIDPLASSGGCLLQSDFGSGNFEVVALQGHQLVHYWRENDHVDFSWHRGAVISSQATAIGPGCLIQSDFKTGAHGNFELVVQEGSDLVHYSLDNGTPGARWQRDQVIASNVSGPGAIIQSDFKSGAHGNFEVVARIGNDLFHYWHDNGNVASPWQRGGLIASNVSGPGAIIQSDLKSGTHGNFEVVAPVGTTLQHFWHDNRDVSLPWQPGQVITSGVTGPGAIIQSDFVSGGHGNFEVVVPKGDQLQHFWHDNSDARLAWQPGGVVATGVSGFGALIQSHFAGGGAHGNFEVVVAGPPAPVPAGAVVAGRPAVDQRLVHWFHDNGKAGSAWQRAQDVAFRGRSEKVCQLTGDVDRERRQPTTSLTGARFGVGAVDLGYPVDDGQRLSFFFGDLRQANGLAPVHLPFNEWTPDDAFGWTSDTSPPTPDACLHLHLDSVVVAGPGGGTAQAVPQTVRNPSIDQGLFNVPSSGFVTDAGLYGIYWTDHCAFPLTNSCDTSRGPTDPNAGVVGRAVLARNSGSGDQLGESFTNVATLPRPFVYTASVNSDRIVGLPAEQKRGVLVFGVPCYRASTPYLASAPAAGVEDLGQWRYLTQLGAGGPTWSANPAAATPLFDASSDALLGDSTCGWVDPDGHDADGCIGELSVDWNGALHKWVMLYGCIGDGVHPRSTLEEGVRVRLADAPWGPWSDPTTIFHSANDNGYCHFMHRGGTPACDDLGGDDGDDNGAPYAPFLLSRYSQTGFSGPDGTGARLYYALSIWNPYQVVIMETNLLLPK